jgi:hypothetical protein
MANKIKDFSLVKSPTAITVRIVSVILVSEITFALAIFLVISLRDALEVDASFALLFWVVFILKAGIVSLTVYKDLFSWSGKQYYTNGKSLVVLNSPGIGGASSEIHDLSHLSKISTNQSTFQKKSNFGTISLLFSKTSYKENLVISDISNPVQVARKLEQLSKD